MIWSLENDAILQELWSTGLSATQIAVEMQCGFSRSAVLGRIHRMKLPWPISKKRPVIGKRQKQEPRADHDLPPLNQIMPPRSKPAHPLRRKQHNSLAEKIALATADPGLPQSLKGDMPDGTGIKLHQLTERTCRYPRGDPKTPEFEFCGARSVEGLPYCAGHCRRAFSALTETT
jgi:GcrA cell cycle regulator